MPRQYLFWDGLCLLPVFGPMTSVLVHVCCKDINVYCAFFFKLAKVLRPILDKIPRNQLAEFLFSDFTENTPLVQYTFTVFAICFCWT